MKFHPDGIEEEDPKITARLKPYRDNATLLQNSKKFIEMAMKFYLQTNPHVKENQGEFKVSILVGWSFEDNEVDFVCYLCDILALPSQCIIEIRGYPRQNAEAKDSQWVR